MHFYKVDATNKQGFKWVCVIDGPPDLLTGKRRQIARRADTQKEARRRVEEAVDKLSDTSAEDKKIKNVTFTTMADDWLKHYSRGRAKESTIRVREKEIKILKRYLAAAKGERITSKAYQEILDDLDKQDYARTTIEGVHVTAGMIFRYAASEKLMRSNPAVGAKIPVRAETIEDIESKGIEEEYLEREELNQFLEAVRIHGKELDLERFYLLAFSGIRSGELCALKWTDLNFETNELRITKTLYNPDNNMTEYKLTPPKTKASIRTIEIDAKVMHLLKLLQDRNLKHKELFGKIGEDYHDENFIFCRPNGYPFIQKSVLNRMDRLLKKTNIVKRATPHIFRHTHVSMLTEADVDINTIMLRVGHDDMKTTMQVYTHVTKKMKKNASEKLSASFESILDI
ncbi:tyrosine-type recombinase/integrase [Paenibacillus sinopodophylli]|uniref:tyrosine-type recombinase/integrase n=1 Tax=Paenibacillus sinopodophylli TaxID=1837342 RepID=UPI00110CF6F2|nr:site-specific integrase [Paenibacillus sinopodophylli]